MVGFVILLVVGVVGVLALGSAIFIGGDAGPRAGAGVAGAVMILFAGLVIPFGICMHTVSAYDVGIVLNGGKPVGEIGPGRSFLDPWEDVAMMDNSVQIEDYAVADPSSGQCAVQVRIANQQTACAEVKLRVQPQVQAVDVLYRTFKSTQGVIDGLVTPALQKYANIEFRTFDPIADVNSTLAPGSPGRPTVDQIAAKIESDMQAAIGKQVVVDNLTIPNIDYDSSVQAELNAAFTQKAKTVIAEQAVQTAVQQAAALRALADAAGKEGVLGLVQQCLNWLNVAAEKGSVPVTGAQGCWPGAGSGVAIPVAK